MKSSLVAIYSAISIAVSVIAGNSEVSCSVTNSLSYSVLIKEMSGHPGKFLFDGSNNLILIRFSSSINVWFMMVPFVVLTFSSGQCSSPNSQI